MARRPGSGRPNIWVELLRLCVVVFCAAAGYRIAQAIGDGDYVLGSFHGLWVGVILGSALGYVLGGVLGRTTLHAVERTEQSLRAVSAEQIVAGVFGGLLGVIAAAVGSAPLILLGAPAVTVPIVGFLILSLGLLGFRVGSQRSDSMLGIIGGRVGMAPRHRSPASFPCVVDTSIAIDGRILDVVRSGFMHGRMVVPSPVLSELQGLADAGDDLRRSRGRRGLETLEALRREDGVEVEVLDDDVPAVAEVDAKLVRICIDREMALLTLDTNLARSAALVGVPVLNLHALTLALRPVVVAGDEVDVLLTKSGREPGQAIGYLDDGTMVVVEKARPSVGREVSVQVTSVLTTANGRMVFARLSPQPSPDVSVVNGTAAEE